MMSGWLMSNKNEKKNTVADCILRPPLKLKWKRKFKHSLLSPVCVDEDMVYLPMGKGESQYALDTNENKVIWKKNIENNPKSFTKFGDKIFVEGSPSKLIDASTGLVLTEFPLHGGNFPIYFADNLYLTCLLFSDLKKWRIVIMNIHDYSFRELHLDLDLSLDQITYNKGCLLFRGKDFRLYKYDIARENTDWVKEIARSDNPRAFGKPIVYNDIIYINTDNGLRVLDFFSGEDLAYVKYLRDFSASAGACIEEDAIYVPSHHVYRVNRHNYNIEWTFLDKNNWMAGMVILSGDHIYFGNQGGKVIALNKQTGRPDWEYQTEGGGHILNCIAVADNKLFVGNSMGYFYCFVEDR